MEHAQNLVVVGKEKSCDFVKMVLIVSGTEPKMLIAMSTPVQV